MRALGCLTLLASLALVLLLPIVFGDLMMQGLDKLHIGSHAALLLVLAMMLGGLVNIPLRRLEPLPGFVAPGVALAAALLLAPDQAPPIAFVAGVLGPLVGADLLHLRDIEQCGPGVMSIGGAGTFDGIVLSWIVAAYLA